MQDKLPLWRRVVKAALATLLTILLLAAFYIAVIMGNPQEQSSAVTVNQEQPLLTAMSSPVMITQPGQLGTLLDEFPAPVLAAVNTNALSFQQGLCEDVPFEKGLGRKVTLTYLTADGALVTVVSIYPARALSLIGKEDYAISGTMGLTLAGLYSVRMENDTAIRMHAQGEEAVYAVTTPKLNAVALRSLVSALQLYQGD